MSIQSAAKAAKSIFSLFVKEIKHLTSNEFRFKLRQANRARLIDVSTEEEYKELHIPGSLNCDVLSPDFINKLEYMDRNRSYFIYCRNGSRSGKAVRLMEEMGFRRIYSLISGLESWHGTLERSY